MPLKNRPAARHPDTTGAPVPKGAEKSLLNAIERLRHGAPTNLDLQTRAKAGKLKINATTATIEAGCARRLAYAFDRVRSALGIETQEPTEQKNTDRPPRSKSLQEVVMLLRADKSRLKLERDLTLSQSAALVVRLRKMEQDVAAEVRKVTRQSNRQENPNQVAGNIRRLCSKTKE